MTTPNDIIRHHIEEFGQHIRRVAAGESANEPGFMYTIGNSQRGLPELLIVGPTDDQFMDLLNYLGEMQRHLGRAFRHEERVDLGAPLPVRIVDAGAEGRDNYAVQVGVFYQTQDFDVQQVLICDPQGRWPDDPDCDPPYSEQPILGRKRT
jgi:hypothetical protein